MNNLTHMLMLAFAASSLLGCANTKPTDPRDPFETFNRGMFKFNRCLDKTVLKPTAVVYNNIVAPPIQKGVSNAFNNLLEPTVMVNDLLQGKINYAFIDLTRMIINTTFGLVGLIDVAKHVGLPYHSNDFGRTFAHWSAKKDSAYLMLPFFGPSTIRDTVGLPFAAATNPLFYFKSNVITYVPFAVSYVNVRAQLLPLDKMIDESFDPYAAIRDAYLQHRRQQIDANDAQGDYSRHHPLQEEETPSDTSSQDNVNHSNDPPPEDDFSFDDKT